MSYGFPYKTPGWDEPDPFLEYEQERIVGVSFLAGMGWSNTTRVLERRKRKVL